ncbi:MAG: hypothetical protein KDC23_06225 [Actinobacteria bacterium]|nr:hypothetical protein [Actinomycetota bacterium]
MSDDLAEFRDEWRDAVAQLIARAWLDAEFKAALIADPHPHLHAVGLLFPDRYVVEFYEDSGAEPGDWHSIGRGSTAVHRFPIPPAPESLAASDEELGIDASALACCCPCASCTGAVSHQTWH